MCDNTAQWGLRRRDLLCGGCTVRTCLLAEARVWGHLASRLLAHPCAVCGLCDVACAHGVPCGAPARQATTRAPRSLCAAASASSERRRTWRASPSSAGTSWRCPRRSRSTRCSLTSPAVCSPGASTWPARWARRDHPLCMLRARRSLCTLCAHARAVAACARVLARVCVSFRGGFYTACGARLRWLGAAT
jgi:hypothetical protein